jgi:hypothetical protein
VLGASLFGLVGACGGSSGRAGADGSESDTAGTADEGGDDSGTAGDAGDDPVGLFDPAAPVLPRLTQQQYRNSLLQLLGDDLPPALVEADTNPYLFFNIGATSTTLSELGTQQYEEAADELSHFVFDDPVRRLELVGCEPVTPGDACGQAFVAAFGRRAFRRPLTATESARWEQIAIDLAEPAGAQGVWEGLRLVVAGMLQSPNFIYRVEVGEPDPQDPTRRRYTGYEMASRLSFLLWNSTPDDALLDAAQDGELLDPAGLVAHADRLLADPRARTAVQAFFTQYFDLGRLDGVLRDPAVYPAYSPTLPQSMKTEVQLLVDDFVFRRDVDVRGIYGTHDTFVNAELAALYGLDEPGASPIAFVSATLPDDGPRAGLLTLGAFLTMNAHETETSPTLRGKYVRERVLCQSVPPPPDNVDTDIDAQGSDGKTLRERLEEHMKNPVCASCHAFIDPPGFLFEHFDSVGVYRTQVEGYPVDASGDLDGAPLASATDLAPLLAEDERVGRCITTQLLRHAQGRLETEEEEAVIDDLDARFAGDDYRFRQLLLHLVSHEGFRYAAEPDAGEGE